MKEETELNEGFEPLEDAGKAQATGGAQKNAADARQDFMRVQAVPDGHGYALTEQQAQTLPALIEQMMAPLMQTMAKMIAHNTEALEQVARVQQVQADRMEALEKQIRLNTPVTPQQAKYLSEEIKNRARELLAKYSVEDAKTVRKLGNAIRKAVLTRYGIGSLAELPKCEYTVAMNQIQMWNEMLRVRDCVREARKADAGEARA